MIKRISFKTKHLIYLFLITPLIFYLGYGTYNNIRLKHYGVCINAVVDYRNEGYRDVYTHYHFFVDEQKYVGESVENKDIKYILKSHTKRKSIFVAGDTIIVVYLKINPAINKSNSSVEKDCDCK